MEFRKNTLFLNFENSLKETICSRDLLFTNWDDEDGGTTTVDKKIKKLEDSKNKVNYLQVLNTTLLICIIQFVSALIQAILF